MGSKLPLFLLPLFSLLLLLTLFSRNLHLHPAFLRNHTNAPRHIHVHKHVQLLAAESACEGTLYTDLCISTVGVLPELRRKTLQEVIAHTVNITMKEVRDSADNCSSLRRKLLKKLEPLELLALGDCLELFADTVDDLNKILSDLSSAAAPAKYYADLQTLLSGAMTNQYTCLDGFAYSKNNTRRFIEGRLRRISRHFSNSLAMAKKLKKKQEKGRKLASSEQFPEYGRMRGGFPAWLSRTDRRLLQAPANQTRVDLTVAKDGSGNFSTVNEALRAAPNNSNTRFVIYIKTGAYFEYVELESRKRNIMFLGDGIGKTWIKGNRSVVDGWTTFRSSTVGQFFTSLQFLQLLLSLALFIYLFITNCMFFYYMWGGPSAWIALNLVCLIITTCDDLGVVVKFDLI